MSSSEAKKRSKNRRLHARFIADGGICFYCQESIEESDATEDHKIPKCRGGDNSAPNLVLACRICNSLKSFLTAEEFFFMLREFPDLIKLRDNLKQKKLRKEELRALREENDEE